MRASVDYLPPLSNGKKSQVSVSCFTNEGGGFKDERIIYGAISCFKTEPKTGEWGIGESPKDVDGEPSSSKRENVGIIKKEEPSYDKDVINAGLTKDECPPDLIPQWRQGRRSKRSDNGSCRNMTEEPRQQKERGVSFREPEKSVQKQQKLQVHCKSTPSSAKASTLVKESSIAGFNIRNTEVVFALGNHRPAIQSSSGEKRMPDDDQLHVVKRSREKPTEELPIPQPTSSPSHAQRNEGEVERVDFQSFDWPKINLTLSRKEKEEDFLIMKGTKLPHRPKKRPKNVERILQFSTPGNWLPEINKARYEVKEKKSTKKRPRGLKGMQSMESYSDG
eukprot:TRINITY_DN40315_c0_g1_i1.p1 TRINITY_DN40315_c0_g1~~TRINITY_DN40315_c0_g1_i1.p1  ORF type:complete len:335 (+),score=66.11 TRINITY_DN40315_c0_g1_i1:180-1184(+)